MPFLVGTEIVGVIMISVKKKKKLTNQKILMWFQQNMEIKS